MHVELEALLDGPARSSDGRRGLSKRSLRVLSHAMERAVGLDRDTPTGSADRLVLASFQRPEYFDAEAERYAALAAAGTTVVASFVGRPGPVPPGVAVAALSPDDPLGQLWALIVLDGDLGVALVARDGSQLVKGGGHTMEQRRSFTAHWSFHRHEAGAIAGRLLRSLAASLPAGVVAAAGGIAARAAAGPVGPPERRLAHVTEFLVHSIEQAQARADAAGVRLANCRSNAEVDELTTLHNRQYLRRFLRPSPVGGALPLTFLLIDVDDLKSINDRFGHAAGDAALRKVAWAIRGSSRPEDTMVRWGGDEFVVLLPGMELPMARAIADRMVRAVQATPMEPPWQDERLSISVGVSVADDRRLPLESLDAALYAAKAAGKGRAHT